MIVAQSGQVVMFDVDGTLVCDIDGSLSEEFECPITYPLVNSVYFKYPMNRNIGLLKDMKARGRYIVVWSQGGWQWAEAVVRALQLTEYVDLIIEKPIAYVDDMDVADFFPKRIFLNE